MNLNGTAHTREGGNAVKRILIIAAVLLSTVAFALPASAGPIDISSNKWFEFYFGQEGSWAAGCAGMACVESGAGNSVFLDEPAWTFQSASSAVLKITDAFLKGDSFNVYDSGALILEMPTVLALGACGDNPDQCYGTDGISYDSIILPAGDHSLTIQVAQSPSYAGAAYFRIDRIVATPEPLSIMLLGLGLLGLGAIRRGLGVRLSYCIFSHPANPEFSLRPPPGLPPL